MCALSQVVIYSINHEFTSWLLVEQLEQDSSMQIILHCHYYQSSVTYINHRIYTINQVSSVTCCVDSRPQRPSTMWPDVDLRSSDSVAVAEMIKNERSSTASVFNLEAITESW